MPKAGWASSILPTKLESANPRPVGIANRGWLPPGTNRDSNSGQNSSPDKMLTREQEPVNLGGFGASVQRVVVETQAFPRSYLSQIFLVEKKDGGQRPVINLKGLYQFVKTEHFKMEGLHLLPDLLQAQD